MDHLPHKITIGEKYGPAMQITEQAAADEYFERLVQHSISFGKSRDEAEQIERANLGYYAGYIGHEARRRVERSEPRATPEIEAALDRLEAARSDLAPHVPAGLMHELNAAIAAVESAVGSRVR